MSDSKQWASAIRAVNVLKGHSENKIVDDARVMVERLTGNAMLCSGPIEIFSQQPPPHFSPLTEADLSPIFVLYGHYIPEHLRIEIFVNRIRADAPQFNAEFLDLLTVVRIHEYAHAVVHTGINAGEIADHLGNFGASGTTDWECFRTDRNAAFSALDEESSELLAQAITWACITQEPTSPTSERLIKTFLALEEKQPQKYKLPPKVRQRARVADWSLILRASQGELRVCRGPSFNLADALMELIRQTAESRLQQEDRS